MREHMSRKEARETLRSVGVDNKFSLRTVDFNWASRQVLTIKDWYPDLKANDVEDAFAGTGVLVDFEPAPDVVFVTGG